MHKEKRDTGGVEADLAHLINLSGKLRMLSHQVVMSALLNANSGANSGGAPSARDTRFSRQLSTALQEFRDITQQLLDPGPDTGLSAETGQVLRAEGVPSLSQRQRLAGFITRAQALENSLAVEDALDLGPFVSGELLDALNQINAAIRDTLDRRIQAKSEEKEPLLNATAMSIDEITRLSKTLQIVAMNASLEAQRAGEHGLAFGEIAREMRGLSQRSMDHAVRLDEDLAVFREGMTTASGRPVTP